MSCSEGDGGKTMGAGGGRKAQPSRRSSDSRLRSVLKINTERRKLGSRRPCAGVRSLHMDMLRIDWRCAR